MLQDLLTARPQVRIDLEQGLEHLLQASTVESSVDRRVLALKDPLVESVHVVGAEGRL